MSHVNFAAKLRRKRSIRKKISGTVDIPRLSFYKSLSGLSVQAIDDIAGRTLFAHAVHNGSNIKAAKELAQKLIADEKINGKRQFVFDRNGGAYHGVIKSFCETLRAQGFKI